MIDRNFVVRSAVAAALLTIGFAGAARAQTVVNLTNMDATTVGLVQAGLAAGAVINSSTNLDLLNKTSALSSGGLFGAAYSSQSQVGYNQLNTIGLTNAGAVNPVVLGNQSPVTGSAPSVTINTIASAYNATGAVSGLVGLGTAAAGSSATINNINSAISSGVNGIVGGNSTPFTGGYGPTAGNVLATGDQVGINTINGVGAAFAAGTAVTLSQLPGAAGTAGGPSVIQGGALNMSTVNSLLAYTGAGSAVVNGSKTDAAGVVTAGTQTAVNTFNASTLIGNNLGVASQQLGDGLNAGNTALQSVNRALAFSAGATDMNIQGFGAQGGPPSVTNLNQTAAVGVNALNLASGLAAGAPGAVTLSGQQSTGYNNAIVGGTTPTGGSVAIPVVSNQVVASTIQAGGFMPDSGSALLQAADWANTAAAAGAPGAPIPGSAAYLNSTSGSAFLTGAGFNTQVNNGNVANAGNAVVSKIGQSANVTNNTVTAGTSAAPIDVTFGPAGYQQRTGTIGLASTSSGISNIDASTGVGTASVADATQAFQNANNTFQGTGNVSGTLSQLASGLDLAAGAAVSSSSSAPVGGLINKNNGGSGQIGAGGAYSGSGPYAVALGGAAQGVRLNDASATTSFGPASITSVTQTGNTFANVVSAPGVVDAGAAGTAAQSFGTLSNYGNANTPLNAVYALTNESGNAAVGSVAQGLSMNVNQLSGTAGVNGSVAQQMGNAAVGISAMAAQNLIVANSGNTAGQGKATLTSNQQVNTVSANAITSSGALGSASSPAAFSQVDSGTSTVAGAYSPAGYVGTLPSNVATVASFSGAGATASSNGLQQLASLQVNSITGGSAAGGLTGLTTQTSTNRNSAIGNSAEAVALNAGAGTIGALGVMSGNATLLNTAQQSAQSLNTMSLTGANNGIVNQATFGTSNQTTSNIARAATNGGYALTTGAQVATNAVNVISAR